MRIKAAAIMTRGRVLYTGKHHGRILQDMAKLRIDRHICRKGEHGFLTECGRFVTRAAALNIARHSGQLRRPIRGVY